MLFGGSQCVEMACSQKRKRRAGARCRQLLLAAAGEEYHWWRAGKEKGEPGQLMLVWALAK